MKKRKNCKRNNKKRNLKIINLNHILNQKIKVNREVVVEAKAFAMKNTPKFIMIKCKKHLFWLNNIGKLN